MPREDGTPTGSALSTEASASDSSAGTGGPAAGRGVPDLVERGVVVLVTETPL